MTLASHHGHELVAYLVAHSGNPEEATAQSLATRGDVLRKSVERGHVTDLDYARKQLDWGAEVDAKGADGRWPLQMAAAAGNREMLELLLERGADPNRVGGEGESALSASVRGGHMRIARRLLAAGARESLLTGTEVMLARSEATPANSPRIRVVNRQTPDIDWDGPLMVGYSGGILLPIECKRGHALKPENFWTHEVLVETAGLVTGDRVGALLDSGRVLFARIGSPTCLLSDACGGDYFHLALDFDRERPAPKESVLVVSLPDFFEARGTHVSKPNVGAAPERCESPPVQPHFVTESPPVGQCAESVASDPARSGSLLETYKFSAEQSNGWTISPMYVRPQIASSPDSWQVFEAGTSLPKPVLTISEPRFGERILWTREDGVGGPGHIGLQFTRVRADGSLELGTSARAGGQPCD